MEHEPEYEPKATVDDWNKLFDLMNEDSLRGGYVP